MFSKVIRVKRSGDHRQNPESIEAAPVTVRLYALPIKDWGPLPLKIRKNDLHLYDDNTISVLRNDREVFIGTIPQIMKRHSDANWIRIQIDFPGQLDEAFGVAAKQNRGIRPKDYVLQDISGALDGEITALREQIKRYQQEQTARRHGSKPSAGEMKADEAEGLQAKPLVEPAPTTPEEQRQLDENLRTLAMMLKREKETDEEAFERIKDSKHIMHYKHDEYWPFYHVDHRFGKIILTINTEHPFYERLYEPLTRAALALDVKVAEGAATAEEDTAAEPQTFKGSQEALVALQLMLLSLARAQSSMALQNPDQTQIFEIFRKEWSETYRTQLKSSV